MIYVRFCWSIQSLQYRLNFLSKIKKYYREVESQIFLLWVWCELLLSRIGATLSREPMTLMQPFQMFTLLRYSYFTLMIHTFLNFKPSDKHILISWYSPLCIFLYTVDIDIERRFLPTFSPYNWCLFLTLLLLKDMMDIGHDWLALCPCTD